MNVHEVYDLFKHLSNERQRYESLWKDISDHVGIRMDTNYFRIGMQNPNEVKDYYIDDPSAPIAVNQAGDFLAGVLWGDGNDVFDIVPTDYVLERAADPVNDYYAFATKRAHYHMNHPKAGYARNITPYAYDQVSFGTSGIGIFKNPRWGKGGQDNLLLTKTYGVDKIAIDEGDCGDVDYVFSVHYYRVARLVKEFAYDKERYESLPKLIRDAYEQRDFNKTFRVIHAVLPNDDMQRGKRGKMGAEYYGVYMVEVGGSPIELFREFYRKKPISIARQVKVRGEIYGRSAGTMLLSTIRSINFMVGSVIEIVEKMGRPALGVYSNAIFGDSVLDTSPDGVTVLNPMASVNNSSPVFPMFDVGDPSAIVGILLPYLNEKVTTAFRLDAMLDFSSDKEMTATESIQRFSIRGKTMGAMLIRQEQERLRPDIERAISIMEDAGELGAEQAVIGEDMLNQLLETGMEDRVIPDAVAQVKKEGLPWYDIVFKNDMARLTKTQKIDELMMLVNSVAVIGGMFPAIIEAVDWYALLADINKNLDKNSQLLFSEREFKQRVQQAAQQNQQIMQQQASNLQADTVKKISEAESNLTQ